MYVLQRRGVDVATTAIPQNYLGAPKEEDLDQQDEAQKKTRVRA